MNLPFARSLGSMASLIASHILGVATVSSNDPWTGEFGQAKAKVIIQECLDRARETPGMNSYACVNSAFEQCEKEREGGHMSQKDLTACASFSRRAWEARLAEVRAMLREEDPANSGRAYLLPLLRKLRESDRHWDAWSADYCALQSERSRGGSIHGMQVDRCLADHAAYRAWELEGLAEDWLN